MRLAAAIYWYQKQEISMEKAANVAGLNRRDFLAVLAREQVDVFAIDFDDLQSELNRG
jgi:predicted HTH domain antitoxin